MGKLDAGVAREFALHCESCSECARISEREREVIRLIRAALAEEPPELMTTCAPVIVATRWPKFTDAVAAQIARNEYPAKPLRILAGKNKLANGMLTFRWFRYAGGERDA